MKESRSTHQKSEVRSQKHAAKASPAVSRNITVIADPNFSKVYAVGASGRGKLNQQKFFQFFLLCRAAFMGCVKAKVREYLIGGQCRADCNVASPD